MFGISARSNRSAEHTHDYTVGNVGGGLQRQVCDSCGQVSIIPLPPTDVRTTPDHAEPGLFTHAPMTIVTDEVLQPVGLSYQFGERRNRQ